MNETIIGHAYAPDKTPRLFKASGRLRHKPEGGREVSKETPRQAFAYLQVKTVYYGASGGLASFLQRGNC